MAKRDDRYPLLEESDQFRYDKPFTGKEKKSNEPSDYKTGWNIEAAKKRNNHFKVRRFYREFTRIDTANFVTGCGIFTYIKPIPEQKPGESDKAYKKRKDDLSDAQDKEIEEMTGGCPYLNYMGDKCSLNCVAYKLDARNHHIKGHERVERLTTRGRKWTNLIFEPFNKVLYHDDRLGFLYTPENEAITIYVNYISEYSTWPDVAVQELRRAARACPWNQYLVLTCKPDLIDMNGKRKKGFVHMNPTPEGAFTEYYQDKHNGDAPPLPHWDFSGEPNIWVGVTVRSPDQLDQIPAMLRMFKAHHYWLNIEPISAPIDNLADSITDPRIGWICVGARWNQPCTMDEYKWMLSVVDQARELGIPVAVKKGKRERHYEVKRAMEMEGRWIRQYPKEFPVYDPLDEGIDDAVG